jgi:hypothetical protein
MKASFHTRPVVDFSLLLKALSSSLTFNDHSMSLWVDFLYASPLILLAPHPSDATHNAAEGERAGTALFAVAVRSNAGVGRTADTLRYLYAASPPQQLL